MNSRIEIKSLQHHSFSQIDTLGEEYVCQIKNSTFYNEQNHVMKKYIKT